MGLYGFKRRFTPAILSGEKLQTIRGKRKHPDEPGDRMYLYEALRTKATKKIAQVECVLRQDITIEEKFQSSGGIDYVAIAIDGVQLGIDELDRLARSDGFKDFADMRAFWNGRLPFDGFIFHWKLISQQENNEWLKRKSPSRRPDGRRRVSRESRRQRGRDRSHRR